MAGGAAVVILRRWVDGLACQLLSELRVAGDAKRPHGSEEKWLIGAGVRLVATGALVERRRVVRAVGRCRGCDIMTVSAQGPNRFGQQVGQLRSVNQMTGITLTGLEGHVLGSRIGSQKDRVMTGPTELLALGPE